MKIFHLLGAAQLLAILFLISKVITLENQVESLVAINDLQTKEKLKVEEESNDKRFENDKTAVNISSGESMQALIKDQANNLSLDNIRQIIRKELKASINEIAHIAKTNKSPKDLLAHISTNPEEVEKTQSQLDFFMSDGEFTAQELNQIETTLTTMNYADRQRVLNNMAQAMNKANVKFNN